MNNKGMTLIELAVVLAIIAVLAAVLTPVVTNYIEQSRIARAQSDVRTIAEAVALYHRDTNRYPIYTSKDNWSADIAAGGDGVGVIGGPGATPADSSAGSSWGTLTTAGVLAANSLELFLNNNYSDVPVNSGVGQVSFRSPYVGSVDEDSWGFKYLLTAGNLERGSTNCAFVISAGPNNVLDTPKNTTCSTTGTSAVAFSPAVDDIVARIR